MNHGGNSPQPQCLSAEWHQLFVEGVSYVLFRWTALQMAVQNEWGGRDSKQKAEDLCTLIISFFSQPKGVLYIDDLENMLDEEMVSLFNAEFDDGSFEEVAYELMCLHEECLQGKYELLEKLRRSTPGTSVIFQSRQANNENDVERSDDEESNMIVDDPIQENMPSISHSQQQTSVDEGWTFVAPKKSRGRR